MKLTGLLHAAALLSASALAHASHPWKAPGANDVRGPCPMLNTLANHGYLPRNGLNITEADTLSALYSALYINQSLSESLFQDALLTNPEENATTFSLENLRTHNIIEHDASLSRQDFYFGNDWVFNETIWDQTLSYWPDDTIDIQAAANARLGRVADSNATNPTFEFTELGYTFSFGDTAGFLLVFGNITAGEVDKSFVEYFFQNERLPTELGWTRQTELITPAVFTTMVEDLMSASQVSGSTAAAVRERGDMHFRGTSRTKQ